MRIIDDVKLDFSDVLLVPHRSNLQSRKDVDLERTYSFKYSNVIKARCTGIIAANMDNIGTFGVADALSSQKMCTALHKHYTVDQLVEYFATKNFNVNVPVFYSMGITDEDLVKFQEVNKRVWLPYINIDVANGYTQRFVSFVKMFREVYGMPDVMQRVIMAGTVVTGDITQELIMAGADIVRVGIGGGALCLTRKQTGVGYPQLSAVIECADAAHGVGGFICSDGGCTSPGDIAKAFGAGADFVMLGSMFAGHHEGIEDGTKVREAATSPVWNYKHLVDLQPPLTHMREMLIYGMSSQAAIEKHSGGLQEYRSSEGREVWIQIKGPIKTTVQDILGGLRSACTYIGARTLKDMPKCATFIRVSGGKQLNTYWE